MLRVRACTQWRQTILDSACGSFVCKKLQLWPAVIAAHTLTHTHRRRRRRKDANADANGDTHRHTRIRTHARTRTNTHATTHAHNRAEISPTAPKTHTHTHTHSHKVTSTAIATTHTIHRHARTHPCTHTNTRARPHARTHAHAQPCGDRRRPTRTEDAVAVAREVLARDGPELGRIARSRRHAAPWYDAAAPYVASIYKDAAATRVRCCCHGRMSFRRCVRTSLQL